MVMESNKSNIGLAAFDEQINIDLFNDVIAFVMATTSADTAAVYRRLHGRHLWYARSDNDNIQAQYGFRYFGELLERFEDRAGSDIRDMRAIALAMAYTKDLLTDSMFVGNQKTGFISKIKRMSVNDTYLKGAVYLLLENENGTEKLLEILTRVTFIRTEEIIFVLSLYDNFDRGFVALKPQLLKLLGEARTVGLIANSSIYIWLVRELCNSETIRDIRTKDMALFRAFMEIPVTFVKPGNKHHSVLLANGYSEEEIIFLNCYAIRCRPNTRSIDTHSITAEKIAVETMVTFINSGDTHPSDAYNHLDYLLNKYSSFAIKISGYKGIYEAVKNRIKLQNPQTFIWLYNNLKEKKVFNFDILDDKWDVLCNELNTNEYQRLFDDQLIHNAEQTSEQLKERIDKFDELTGLSYIESFGLEHEYIRDSVFKLLVDKDIVNLTAMFRAYVSLETVSAKSKDNAKTSVFAYVRYYIKGIHTRQAFDFFKSFFEQYNFKDMYRFFTEKVGYRGHSNSDHFFLNELYHGPERYYNAKSKEFDIKRSFLTDDEQKEMFCWIDDYMFRYKPENYVEFAVCMLCDPFITTLFPHNELRQIYHMVSGTDNSHFRQNRHDLKKMFLTEVELQAEQEAEKAKKEKAQQDEVNRRIQELRDKLKSSFDGSFMSIMKYLNIYQHSHDSEDYALMIAFDYLPIVLAEKNNHVSISEFGHFLQFCGKLTKQGLLSIEDTKKYVLAVEEVEELVENN